MGNQVILKVLYMNVHDGRSAHSDDLSSHSGTGDAGLRGSDHPINNAGKDCTQINYLMTTAPNNSKFLRAKIYLIYERSESADLSYSRLHSQMEVPIQVWNIYNIYVSEIAV